MRLIPIVLMLHAGSFTMAKRAAMFGDGIDSYFNLWYVGSLLLLAIRALFWQQVLKTLPLSTAYTLMSLIFVMVPVLAYFVFGEPIMLRHILGTFLIIIGVVHIALDSGKERFRDS
jgi:drug/metabolite transporter (DMT)-like permease